MNHLSHNPLQIVRPLKRLGSIPNLCTACLLFMEVRPIPALQDNEKNDRMPHLFRQAQKNADESNARFEPHIETIKRMRAEGETWKQIAKLIRMDHRTVSGYVWRNPRIFKNES